MSNDFAINLTATDKFSVTFQTLKDKASESDKQLRASTTKQADQFKQLRSAINNTADGAQRVADSLGIGRGVVGGLLSIGGAGSLAGGALAAAVAVGALTKSWSEAGQEIDRTRTILGVSAEGLQVWRESARLAGGTAEGMTATIGGLGKTLQDAMWGRNPQAAMLMRHFGIGIRKDANGAVDVLGTMNNIAAVMQQIRDPQALRVFAATMGMPEESIYTLGRRGAGQYAGMARGSGVIMDSAKIRSAVETERGLTALGQRARAAGNYVGGSEANPLGGLTRRFAEKAEADARAPRMTDEEAQAAADELRGRFKPRSGASAVDAASAPTSQVHIKVEVPPGAKVSATSSGPPLKVERSGPGTP